MLFFKGRKIYYRLNKVPGVFVVSVDRGIQRFYLGFSSLDEFERWYVKLPPDERTINEVIRSNTRKLVLDIDGEQNSLLHMFDFERHIRSRIHNVFMTLDIGIPEVILYRMTDGQGEWCTKKISYHVVVSNFAFSAHTCLGLCLILSLGQAWGKHVDTGVYKGIQCMRIAGSTKYGERRWKWALQGAETEFRRGLLSCLEGTVLSDVTCNLKYHKIATDFVSPKHVDMSQFRAVRRENIVSLYRIRPGFCPKCKRIHDKENAMIRCLPNGSSVFVCWRYC